MERPDDTLIPADTPWLADSAVQTLCHAVERAGCRILFVGGCVRNAVMGLPASDVDLATDAQPETLVEIAETAGLRAVPTGIDHGTVTIVVDGTGFEVTTFRKDVKTDGRRATIQYSTDIAEDARRRDFTMNALYATREGRIVDPLGGLGDAIAGRVRFIEDAGQRIREDYLRILRFFRFSAWYSDPAHGFDADALAAIARNLDGLDALSAERVGQEMLKLLAAPDPAPAVATMDQLGILTRILPGATGEIVAPLVFLEKSQGINPDPVVRLAAIGGEEAAERLRLSKRTARRRDILRAAMSGSEKPVVLGYKLGLEDGVAALLLRAAALSQPDVAADIESVRRGARSKFPLKAADFSDRYSGKKLGDILREREQAWLASGLRLTRSELLK